MKCGNCNVEFPNGVNFCPACGASAAGSMSGSLPQDIESSEASVAGAEQSAQMSDVSVGSGLARLLVAFALSAFCLSMVMCTVSIDLSRLPEILPTLSADSSKDYLMFSYAFVPFMGLGAAVQLVSCLTGKQDILFGKAYRYPVRVLALLVLLFPLAQYLYLGKDFSDPAISHLFVSRIAGLVLLLVLYYRLLTKRQHNWPKALSVDMNPLGEALVLSFVAAIEPLLTLGLVYAFYMGLLLVTGVVALWIVSKLLKLMRLIP